MYWLRSALFSFFFPSLPPPSSQILSYSSGSWLCPRCPPFPLGDRAQGQCARSARKGGDKILKPCFARCHLRTASPGGSSATLRAGATADPAPPARPAGPGHPPLTHTPRRCRSPPLPPGDPDTGRGRRDAGSPRCTLGTQRWGAAPIAPRSVWGGSCSGRGIRQPCVRPPPPPQKKRHKIKSELGR